MNTFVGESITPVFGEGAVAPAAGEPIVPSGFIWRSEEYRIEAVLKTWKESRACKHGSSERYRRKHWYRIRTTDGREMEIYLERQARSSRQRKKRWWLFSVSGQSEEEMYHEGTENTETS